MKRKLFSGAALLALALSLSLFASSNSKDEFTAHEWGTFTSVQAQKLRPSVSGPRCK